MTKHYHVLVGSEGGYLPNANEVFTRRRDADQFAAAQARDIAESGWDDIGKNYPRFGSASSGLIVIDTGRSLDTIVEVNVCTEDDCMDSDSF